jgi:flagellar biosynthesis chaperone FliJ
MAKRADKNDLGFGSDSFLDVVANVVGILIILVMVVGMRVKQTPAVVEAPPPPPDTELAELTSEMNSLESDTKRLLAQAAVVARESQTQQQLVLQLASTVSQQQRELEEGRQQLDARAQQDLLVQREVWAANSLAQQLERELAASTTEKKSIKIDSYPTPLSRTVDGKEAHFQLMGGRIAYIPLEDLLNRLKTDAQQQVWQLKDLPETTSIVGPIGGFRLRYTFERVEVPMDDRLASGRYGTLAQLSQWTLIPVSSHLGETAIEALADGSEFRQALAQLPPRKVTITLWTYPDSFDTYREIRKALYQMGYATAGRPLPEGTPIGGSPRGSKSAAQ